MDATSTPGKSSSREWSELTPDEKRQQRLEGFIQAKDVEFVDKESETAYRQRARRLVDVYNVREPDRVPVSVRVGNLPFTSYGIDFRTSVYDYDKAVAACTAFNAAHSAELECFAIPFITPAKVMDSLDYRLYTWPGHGLSADSPNFQFAESEYMKAEEYDALIHDPSDFWLRTYLPRVFGSLEPLSLFRPATDIVEIIHVNNLMPLAEPRVLDMLQKMIDVGKEFQKLDKAMGALMAAGPAHGFPRTFGPFCKAPFDVLGDSLRGTRGIMTDMYRRPEKLLAALDAIADVTIDSILSAPRTAGAVTVNYPLHKGADGWMSQKQFETFYWPSLRKVMNAFVQEGLIQWLFAEGSYNSRLETVNEFPKGSVVWYFDQTDMARAKTILGKTCCLQGNLSVSTLVIGSPAEVKARCRKLIEDCGEGGGYILSAGAMPENPKIENLRAMVEAAREYGVYR